MRIEQEKVALFHEKTKQPVGDRPQMVDRDLAFFRFKLMREELEEYWEAYAAGDIVKIADALGDLIYTALGTANVHGIRLQEVFDEIHASNMTKGADDPKTGKPSKGPGYRPPRLAEIIFNQSHPTEV